MLDSILAATETPAAVPESRYGTVRIVRELDEPKPEAPATGRLTTAQYVVTLAQLEQQLKTAVEGFQKLPDCPPQQVETMLRAIMDAARAASDKAAKLLAANR